MRLKYVEKPKRISTDTQILYGEAKAFADKYNVDYIETSVKTGENLDKAMRLFAYNVHVRRHGIDSKIPFEMRNSVVNDTKSTSLLHGTKTVASHKHCCSCAIL